MDEIAAGASVTKPILYRTIGDKAALMVALSESLIDQIDASVAAAASSATDPRAAFELAIRGYLAAVEADRNIFLFVNASAPGTEQFRGLVDRSAASMIDVFSEGQRRAGSAADSAEHWAWAIVGALQVVTTMWLRDGEPDIDRVVANLSQLLWSGLAASLDESSRSARDRTPRA